MAKYGKLPDEDTPTPKSDDVSKRALRGLRVARAALTATSIEGLIEDTNLPALEGTDALADLATRLDREADLWRNLAFREMARTVWASRMITAITILVVVADLALSAVAGLGALFGAEASGRGILVLTAALVATLGLGAAIAAVVASRKSQREVIQGALARADLAELRLHRVAVVMAFKRVDDARYVEALVRLERDSA